MEKLINFKIVVYIVTKDYKLKLVYLVIISSIFYSGAPRKGVIVTQMKRVLQVILAVAQGPTLVLHQDLTPSHLQDPGQGQGHYLFLLQGWISISQFILTVFTVKETRIC
jgi:hypothetical protein